MVSVRDEAFAPERADASGHADEQLREQRDAAVRVVGVHARDEVDERLLLQALGLAPYVSKTGTRPQDRCGMGPKYTPKPSAIMPDCGSEKGAQAHHRADEPLCPVCEAWAEKRRARTRVPHGSRCGTPAGAQMHRQLGEKICGPCHTAENDASRARYTPTGNPPGRRLTHNPVRPQLARKHLAAMALIDCGLIRKDPIGRWRSPGGRDVSELLVDLRLRGLARLERDGGELGWFLTDAGLARLEKGITR